MKLLISILAFLAVTQVTVIMTTWTGDAELASNAPGGSLLNINRSAVDILLIRDKEKEIKLSRKDGQWFLESGFPADSKKVDSLLVKLAKLKYNLPIATSPQALNRFQVADDAFDRYLLLQADGETQAELYLGTGAGARQSHVRSGEQAAVYTAAIGSYDLPVSEDLWQDKGLLQFDSKKINTFAMDGVTLEQIQAKDGNKVSLQWKEKEGDPGVTVDYEALDDGLKKLGSLQFSKVLQQGADAKCDLSEPLLTVKLGFQGGDDRTYTFGKIKDSEDLCLNVSDRKEFFQLASYLAAPVVERLKQITSPEKNDKAEKGASDAEK